MTLCPLGAYIVQFQVTQMVHDLREEVVSQRFKDLRQKMVQVGGRHPAATNLNRLFDGTTSLFGFTTVLYNPYKGSELCALVGYKRQVGRRHGHTD
ncbi:hypothetical protein KIN20_014338 [Parelaphostrongylus tenuis]|uniref:Uncharacterized protein n=1 Tax=Parelaphostrongylus tenuis TaxID=148309 RepID=A0AAD5QNA4_PARTN|nr:hypothetical protein KIN20_014338 [Parelaphostrongylus tenuis]